MKIAIAVESKKMEVAKRLGRAPWFAIYELLGDEYKLIEMAVNEHAKEHHGGGGHHHHEEHREVEIEEHRQHIAPLRGIDAILARAVGPNMKDAIAREGIVVYRFPLQSGNTAPALMDFLIQNRAELDTFKI